MIGLTYEEFCEIFNFRGQETTLRFLATKFKGLTRLGLYSTKQDFLDKLKKEDWINQPQKPVIKTPKPETIEEKVEEVPDSNKRISLRELVSRVIDLCKEDLEITNIEMPCLGDVIIYLGKVKEGRVYFPSKAKKFVEYWKEQKLEERGKKIKKSRGILPKKKLKLS